MRRASDESVSEHIICWDMCDIEGSVLDEFAHEVVLCFDVSTSAVELGLPGNGDRGSVVGIQFGSRRFFAIVDCEVACDVLEPEGLLHAM